MLKNNNNQQQSQRATKTVLLLRFGLISLSVLFTTAGTCAKTSSANNDLWSPWHRHKTLGQLASNQSFVTQAASSPQAQLKLSIQGQAQHSKPQQLKSKPRAQRNISASPQLSQVQKCALVLQRKFITSPSSSTNNNKIRAAEKLCISWADVEAAIVRAKNKLSSQRHLTVLSDFGQANLATAPSGEQLLSSIEPSVELIDELGEFNLLVSEELAKQYALTSEEIASGLPLIDVSRTSLWSWCPVHVRTLGVECDPSARYRFFTGHCNNLRSPVAGAALTSFSRLLPLSSASSQTNLNDIANIRASQSGEGQNAFADGLQAPRLSVERHKQLPLARLVTQQVHVDDDKPSSELSLMIMVFGQIIDHDIALAAPPRDENGLEFTCCAPSSLAHSQNRSNTGRRPFRAHKNCLPMQVPQNDILYAKHNVKCLDFKRSLVGLRVNCALGSRANINKVTSTIDANTVYGSSKAVADSLRTFSLGQLQTQQVDLDLEPISFDDDDDDNYTSIKLEAYKPLLPAQVENPELDCLDYSDEKILKLKQQANRRQTVPGSRKFCFVGGDERASEQPTLTMMHTILVREHNYIASELFKQNPHWQDDRLYHEARHILIGQLQHVLVNEYLPTLLGEQLAMEFNLTSEQTGSGYWRGYKPNIEPSVTHAFATAAFRQGHTFIQGKVQLHNPVNHKQIGHELLRNMLKRPFHFYTPGKLDAILAGAVNTHAQSYDSFISREISGHLFVEARDFVGMDLAAINLARGREQGTPSYTAFRSWCNLGAVQSFDDLSPLISERTARLYAQLYASVDDIDLWSGGVSEQRVMGGQIGPTFACIIARQFAILKLADRFWYENGPRSEFASAFSLGQLNEIRKTRLSRILCSNSDLMSSVQQDALWLPHQVLNPRVSCDSLPRINFSHWRQSSAQGQGQGQSEKRRRKNALFTPENSFQPAHHSSSAQAFGFANGQNARSVANAFASAYSDDEQHKR